MGFFDSLISTGSCKPGLFVEEKADAGVFLLVIFYEATEASVDASSTQITSSSSGFPRSCCNTLSKSGCDVFLSIVNRMIVVNFIGKSFRKEWVIKKHSHKL